jgi:hypothetical protein
LQFGLSDDEDGRINEIFLVPTKHFQVCLNDERRFRLVMEQYGLREGNRLQFLDEYPRTTIRLSGSHEPEELLEQLAYEIEASPSVNGKPPH